MNNSTQKDRIKIMLPWVETVIYCDQNVNEINDTYDVKNIKTYINEYDFQKSLS